MRKYILAATLFSLTICTSLAQDITSVFLKIPNTVLFELDSDQKNKLVAKPNDTTKISIESALGVIKRTAMSDNFIALQTSEAGTLQIKLLPLINDSKIICVIKTVCGKACDSNIQFFTTDWTPLPAGLFPTKTHNWFLSEDIDQKREAFDNALVALDMNPIKLTLSEKDDTLLAEYQVEGYLSSDDYDKIKPFISSNQKTFNWDKSSFK